MSFLPLHYRALVALLFVTALGLLVCRWVLAGSSLSRAFNQRAVYWLLATSLAFLIANFWVLLAVLALLFILAARKDENPVSLYLMFILCLPPHAVDTGSIGPIENLMEMSTNRMLSLVILLPLAIKLIFERLSPAPGQQFVAHKRLYRVTDTIVVLFAIYQISMYIPLDSATHVMRRSFLITIDFLLPYFVISRFCTTRERIMDSLGAILIAGMILSIVATFEHAKGWLLYETIHSYWDLPPTFTVFLLRDDVLRAVGPVGHSLVLGHLLVICLGLAGIFLRQLSKPRSLALFAILLMGMYSTVSRGPWVAGAIVLLMMGVFHPRAGRYYLSLVGIGALVVGAIAVSPWAEKVVNLLPFVGNTDQSTVDYRQQLLETTFFLVGQNPLFGSVTVLEQMEHLRQGQGIIDLVNVYADIALTFGLIGLTFFVLFFVTAMGSALYTQALGPKRDRKAVELVGFSSMAMFGSMVTLVGISNFATVPLTYTAMVALLVAMSRLPR